jgi:iron(III) transport system permease protein
VLSVGAGVAVLILSTIIAMMSARHPSRLSKFNDTLSLLPLAVPSIALASAILWTYVQLLGGIGRALFGSLMLIGLAYVTKFVPVVVRQVSAQLVQLSPELEQASRVSGANGLRTALRVTAPLLSPALGSAFFLAFVLFFREFSVSVLLFQHGSEVFSVAMFDMYTNGELGQVGAATVILVAVLIILLSLSNRILGTQKPANTFR